MSDTAQVIVADPPWKFASNSTARPGRNARRHYECLTADEIVALPVWDACDRDSLMFMWVTIPHLPTGLDVLSRVGFRYKSGLVWVKDRIGTGYWARNRHEIVLIGTRGRFPCPKPSPFPDSVISGQQRQHSRKPDYLQDVIDQVWPKERKLEVFARQARPGWASFGNETDKFAAEHAA